MVKQGDIILISFDPGVGHEQRKTRPALVVSTNTYHKYCKDFAIVCPISHANNFPLNIPLPNGLKTTGRCFAGTYDIWISVLEIINILKALTRLF